MSKLSKEEMLKRINKKYTKKDIEWWLFNYPGIIVGGGG